MADTDTKITSADVRVGQEVTIYGFPAGRFGEWEEVDNLPRTVGGTHTGTVVNTEPIELADPHMPEIRFVGVRVRFDDGREVDTAAHAYATWHGGIEPTEQQLTATAAQIADEEAAAAEEQAAFDEEGALSLIVVHPGEDEDGDPAIVLHLPGSVGEEPFYIEPEQAEAFALRLLRQATIVRLMAEAQWQEDLPEMQAKLAEQNGHDHPHD